MVREVFLEHDAESILSIPLSTTLPADRLVWTAAANGKFNVKSAYHLARNRDRICTGESSDPSGLHRFWQRLWKAKTPSKVRNFAWRACQNILPTKMNLFHRKVNDNPTCEVCGLSPETIIHALCHCTKARTVWSHCNLSNMVVGNGDFMDILWQCVLNQGNSSCLLDMILMIAWSIWRNRNEVRHGGKNMTAAEIYGRAAKVLHEYTMAQEIPHQLHITQPAQHRWIPPPLGWYKVNVDGAIFSKHKWSGIGVIARDDKGLVVAAMSKKLELPLQPLEIEAKALEQAAIFAKDICLQKVIFESDNMVVCSAVRGEVDPSSAIANIITGTIHHMRMLSQFETRHTRREGNMAAHGLAKYAQYVEDFVTWMEETPPIISSEISSDVNQLSQAALFE